MTRFGWNRYSIINLQYKGQVVAKLAGETISQRIPCEPFR